MCALTFLHIGEIRIINLHLLILNQIMTINNNLTYFINLIKSLFLLSGQQALMADCLPKDITSPIITSRCFAASWDRACLKINYSNPNPNFTVNLQPFYSNHSRIYSNPDLYPYTRIKNMSINTYRAQPSVTRKGKIHKIVIAEKQMKNCTPSLHTNICYYNVY